MLVGPFVPHPRAPGSRAGAPVPARRRPLPAPRPRPLGGQRDPARGPGGAPRGDPAPRPAREPVRRQRSRVPGAELARSCAILGIRLVHRGHTRPRAGASRSASTGSSGSASCWRPSRSASRRSTSSTTGSPPGSSAGSTCGCTARPASRPSRGTAAQAPRSHARAAALGLPVVGPAAGEPDRDRELRGQRVRGGPRARRADGRAALSGPRTCPRSRSGAGAARRAGPRPGGSPATSTGRPPAAARAAPRGHRHRLSGPGARRPRGRRSRPDRVPRPAPAEGEPF